MININSTIHAYTVLFQRVNNNSHWLLLASFQAYFWRIYSSRYYTTRFALVLAERGVAYPYKDNRVTVCTRAIRIKIISYCVWISTFTVSLPSLACSGRYETGWHFNTFAIYLKIWYCFLYLEKNKPKNDSHVQYSDLPVVTNNNNCGYNRNILHFRVCWTLNITMEVLLILSLCLISGEWQSVFIDLKKKKFPHFYFWPLLAHGSVRFSARATTRYRVGNTYIHPDMIHAKVWPIWCRRRETLSF